MKSLKIGPIKLKNRLFLAPMVDVTDLPYRLLCQKTGAGITYTEMLNIGSILHKNKKTLNMLKRLPEETPVGIQITGRNTTEFKKIADHDALHSFDLVDINCGCPSIRITGNQSGSYLLKTPETIGDMIRILKDAGHVVTAKIRLGFKNNNVLKISKQIEKAGADLLTVHARLSTHGRSIPADWNWINKVKKELGIPVVGNGDVFNGESASHMLDIAEGVMIARAAIGNPLIFKQVLHYLRTNKELTVTPKQRINLFKDYLHLAQKHDVVELPRIKYLAGNFLKDFNGAAAAREQCLRLRTFEDIHTFILDLYQKI